MALAKILLTKTKDKKQFKGEYTMNSNKNDIAMENWLNEIAGAIATNLNDETPPSEIPNNDSPKEMNDFLAKLRTTRKDS